MYRIRASVNVSFLRFSLYDANGFSFHSLFASGGDGSCAEQKR